MFKKTVRWIKKNKRNYSSFGVNIDTGSRICVSTVGYSFLPSGGNDWAGFWGAYLGAIIGACVTVWGIKKTVNENRKLSFEPYLLFEEVDNIPENTLVYGCLVEYSGNSYAEKIVCITNVGNGAAVKLEIGKDIFFEIPILKKGDAAYVALEYGIEVPSNNIERLSKEEIMKYCSQNKKTGISVRYSDVLGNISEYELCLRLECMIDISPQSHEKKLTQKIYLKEWKRK